MSGSVLEEAKKQRSWLVETLFLFHWTFILLEWKNYMKDGSYLLTGVLRCTLHMSGSVLEEAKKQRSWLVETLFLFHWTFILLEWKNYMKNGSYLLLRLGARFGFPKWQSRNWHGREGAKIHFRALLLPKL
jgi:hypothetical protein